MLNNAFIFCCLKSILFMHNADICQHKLPQFWRGLFGVLQGSCKEVSLHWLFLRVLLYRVKTLVWLDRMLNHRADPTNAMIGCDNSKSRSLWGVEVKQLTNKCCNLIGPHPPQTS